MPQPRSPYLAAWQLWRAGARRSLSRPGPVVRRGVEVPLGTRPASPRAQALLTLPGSPRGWVLLPGASDAGGLSPRLAGILGRAGFGTLELPPPVGAQGLAARAEQLVAASAWLLRQPAVRVGEQPRLGLVGCGVDAAAALVAAGSGELSVAALVAAGGRFEGLDEASLAGLGSPLRLIASRDDALGRAEARQVAAWLMEGDLAHDLVLVPGAAGTHAEARFSSAGARHARWLAGAWLVDHLGGLAPAEAARRARARRLRLARGGLSLLPVGAFVAAAWMGQAGRPEGARAAAGRSWAGADLAERFGGPLPVLKLDAPLPGTIELSGLNGTSGFRSNGISADDFSGFAVSGAGDVNMDGFDDILIGADLADPNGTFSGQSYVVYGGSAVPGTVELSALNGTNGFRVNGIVTGDFSGYAVSEAGDVNMDGFDDVLIGAPFADPNGTFSGQSYVVYGGSAVPATVELSALNGTSGFRVNGISATDYSGRAVSGAGDVNMDGFDDILIGAHLADPNGTFSGQSYVVYGGSAVPATVELSALNGTSGFRVNGISATDYSGRAVSGAGDVNMDGFDDILIGAYRADPNGTFSGQSYVVYGGSAVPATVELSALNGTSGFRVNGISASDYSGRAVSGAGDVNMDGFDDILIGAYRADPNGDRSGQSYVVYGGSAVPATVELSALNGTNGLTLNGISADDFSGFAVSGAGDVNMDGFDDILVGAYRADPNGDRSGQSYVVYGGSALPATVELSALNGTNGFRVNGISSYDFSGRAVSGAGDVNMDGFDDILIGAHLADPNGTFSGQSYVVYGDGEIPPTPTPTPTNTPIPTSTPTPVVPTAVQITGFAARVTVTGAVQVAWETAAEVDVLGFHMFRAAEGSEAWTRVNPALVPARGGAAGGATYRLADAPGVGAFRYRLEVVNADGAPQRYGPVEAVVRALRAFLPWGGR